MPLFWVGASMELMPHLRKPFYLDTARGVVPVHLPPHKVARRAQVLEPIPGWADNASAG